MSIMNKKTHCFDCDKGELRRSSGYDKDDAAPIVVYYCDRCKATKKVWLDPEDMRFMHYKWTSGKEEFYFKPNIVRSKYGR